MPPAGVTRRFLQEEKDRIIESELKGLTLRIYWHILSLNKKETIGIRSIQRTLGLSSPSVASHHLEKLKTLGLLEKDATGEYRLVGQVKVGILQNFVEFFSTQHNGICFWSVCGCRFVERDAEGLEDEAVLMSVQPVLTCGIIRGASLYDHLRE